MSSFKLAPVPHLFLTELTCLSLPQSFKDIYLKSDYIIKEGVGGSGKQVNELFWLTRFLEK